MLGGDYVWDRKSMDLQLRPAPIPDDRRNAWTVKRQLAYIERGYSKQRISELMRGPNEPTWVRERN
jgi:hypothetical protein